MSAEPPKQLSEPEITDVEADKAYETIGTNPDRFSSELYSAKRKWGKYLAKPGFEAANLGEMVMTVEKCDLIIAKAEKEMGKKGADPVIALGWGKVMTEAVAMRGKLIKDASLMGKMMKAEKPPKSNNAPPNFAVQVNVGDKNGQAQDVEVIQRGNGALLPGKTE